MIAILYPKGDEDASYLAYKIRAGALGQGVDVYIPPRAGRRATLPKEIKDILKKARSGFFLVADPEIGLDNATWREIKFLLDSKKKVKALIPGEWMGLDLLKGLLQQGDILIYNPDKPSRMVELLRREVEQVKMEKESEQALLAVGLLGIALLLMWGISAKGKG